MVGRATLKQLYVLVLSPGRGIIVLNAVVNMAEHAKVKRLVLVRRTMTQRHGADRFAARAHLGTDGSRTG